MDARPEVGPKPGRERFSFRALVILLVFIAAGGGFFAYRAIRNEDAHLRSLLLTQARMMAQSVNPQRVANLTGSAADLDAPDYQRIKEQLESARGGNPQCRFLYLLGMRGNDIFFYIDSEPAESKDNSPPGQVYTEAPEAMRRAFRGKETVTGPYSDRWGVWITAITPMMGAGSGNPQAVFCMDVDARNWANSTYQEGVPPVLVALLLAAMLAFFFVLLRRSEDALRRIAASEEAARESSKRFEAVVEYVQAGIVLIDPVDHTIVVANHTAAAMCGVTPADMTGQSCHQFVCLASSEHCPFFELHQGFHSVERVLMNVGAGEVPVIMTAVPVTINGRRLLLESFIDITDRKRAEEERAKLEVQLRQSQKMEAVGQLAGGVAHDFNNLLQAILGYTELVRSHLGPDSEDGKALDEVCKAAGRAADLTRQLLTFSRRQIIQPVDLNLNELLQSVLKMIRRVIGEHIELCFMPGEHLGTVRADRGQIEQILMNLCVNARDAMPNGGTLNIETKNVDLNEAYCREHPWATAGQYVLLSVTDTGHGMDEATLAQAFEPFFTTKDIGQGTGLGLATVYGIVKHHQGLAHVRSEPDKGTVFQIYFPIVERPAEEAAAHIEGRTVGGSETILVAEDEEMVRGLVVRLLENAGYTPLQAVDGEDALRVFKEHADTIDMALLDVMMPKLGGREVMDRIQAQCPRIRFLFSSGYSEYILHTDFIIEEGLHLVSKPYRSGELLRAIRETLDAPPA